MPDMQQLVNDLEIPLSGLFPNYKVAYESGAWTPAFAGTGTAGAFTYTNTAGRYVRWMNIVHIWGRVAISAIGTPPTTLMVITGLPYAAANVANQFGGVFFTDISNFNYAAGAIDLQGLIQPNEQLIRLLESFDNAGSQSAPAANFTNANCSLIFAGMYLLD